MARIFYINFNGGPDTNTGLSQSQAWRRHPYMQNFGGSYTHQAGDRFIFKGGVMWPASCFTFNISQGGSSSTPDYYGVDPNWFVGTDWRQPQFDQENGSGSAGMGLFVTGQNITFDNIEFYRYKAGSGATAIWAQVYIQNGDGNFNNPTVKFTNCHWRATNQNENLTGARCIYQNGCHVETDNCEFEQFDLIHHSDVTGNGTLDTVPNVVCSNASVVSHCWFHHTVNALLGNGVWHDSEFGPMNHAYSIDGDVHGNAMEPFANTTAYNNYIHDLAPTIEAILTDPATSDPSIHFFFTFYNNLIRSGNGKGISFDFRRAPHNTVSSRAYNNTVIDASIGMASPSYMLLSDIRNNHVINGGIQSGSSNTTTIADHNLLQTTSEADAAGYKLANLYQPTSSGAPTVGTGADLSSLNIFTTDRLGNTRSAPWDRGAYEWTGSAPPPTPTPVITVNPTSLDFGTIATGTTASPQSVTVSNSGTGTLTGSASVTAPFTTDPANNSYSLTAGQSKSIAIGYSPTVKGSHSGTVAFSGGAGASVSVTGTAYDVAPSLTFEADTGTVISPFTASGGHVSQTIETLAPLQGGKAIYGVTIPTLGDYTVSALVNAPGDGSNSFFVNFDTEPSDPTMIWDVVQFTTGYESRTVSWRGAGAFNAPQFAPKVWTLAPGVHQLIVRGREANASLGTITVNPPASVPVIPDPPEAPASPTPTNGQTNVAINTAIAWAENTAGCLFNVFLGTTNPPTQVASDLATNLYNLASPLAYSTTYYFKVNAHKNWSSNGQNGVVSTDGPIWSFTTLAAPVALPPVVSLTLPVNGTIYTAPATVNFAATAVGQGGATITKVEYYIDNVKVDQDLTAPYTGSAAGVTAGDHTLKAKATDSGARTTDSTPVSIHVMAAGTSAVPRIIFVTT